MTFEINVRQIRISEKNNWKAKVELGKDYWINVRYKNGKLECDKDIKQEPVSYDTILEQMEKMINNVEIPNIETGRYGDIEQ